MGAMATRVFGIFLVLLSGTALLACSGGGSSSSSTSTPQKEYVPDDSAINDLASISFLPIGPAWLVVDVDNDGLNDVIFQGADFPTFNPAPIYVFRNRGNDKFDLEELKQVIPGVSDPVLLRRLVKADINGDNIPDIIGAESGMDISPFAGGPNVLITSSLASFPTFSDFTHAEAVGDIDGDSYPDIFFGNICCGSQRISYFLLNDGAGNFVKDETRLPDVLITEAYGYPPQILDSKLVDVNEDGNLDLVLGVNQGDPGMGFALMILLNPGDGDFSGAAPITLLSDFSNALSTVEILPLELNGDDHLDLIVSTVDSVWIADGDPGNGYQNPGLHILMGDGSGKFVDDPKRLNYTVPQPQLGPNSFWVQKLSTIHFNNDNYPDLLVEFADMGQAESLILLNDGQGNLAPITMEDYFQVRIPANPFGIITRDLPLIPITGSTGKLDFLSFQAQCVAADSFTCTEWTFKATLYKKTN